MFQTEVAEKIKTHIFMFNNFSLKIVHFNEIKGGKFCTARQATDDNMTHAQRMLDTSAHKHSQNM